MDLSKAFDTINTGGTQHSLIVMLEKRKKARNMCYAAMYYQKWTCRALCGACSQAKM